MARGQYDDAELEKLGGSCREYNLPRSDPLSKVKGWICGNTKIGPVLELAITHFHGRCGIEIVIQSLVGDGTCSWVMIVNGINKNVAEMTENQNIALENVPGNLLPKQDQKQTATLATSSTTALPYDQREWIDVKAGLFDKSCFEVSKIRYQIASTRFFSASTR